MQVDLPLVADKQVTPADLTKHFENIQVRIYGDLGMVNGLVVITDKGGNSKGKRVFTHVFLYRDDRWQSINAQENAV